MPTLGETSSYTVQECMAAGVPLLAARVGGLPELLAPATAAAILFPPNDAPALATALTRAMIDGCGRCDFSASAWQCRRRPHPLIEFRPRVPLAQPSVQPATATAQWLRLVDSLHRSVSAAADEKPPVAAGPVTLVSVVITHHHGRAGDGMLAATLASVRAQTHPLNQLEVTRGARVGSSP